VIFVVDRYISRNKEIIKDQRRSFSELDPVGASSANYFPFKQGTDIYSCRRILEMIWQKSRVTRLLAAPIAKR
jgi:hypothetical protein